MVHRKQPGFADNQISPLHNDDRDERRRLAVRHRLRGLVARVLPGDGVKVRELALAHRFNGTKAAAPGVGPRLSLVLFDRTPGAPGHRPRATGVVWAHSIDLIFRVPLQQLGVARRGRVQLAIADLHSVIHVLFVGALELPTTVLATA